MRSTQERSPAIRPTGTKELMVAVPDKVHATIVKLAAAANVSTTLYATQLLMAAYTARHKPTGDRDLDAMVARVVILDAIEDTPIEDIVAYVGLSEPTIKTVLKAWHAELAGVNRRRVAE